MTLMIEKETSGDLSDKTFISPVVSSEKLTSDVDYPIPSSTEVASPWPTFIVTSPIDVRPEAGLVISNDEGCGGRVSVPLVPGVVLGAQAVGEYGIFASGVGAVVAQGSPVALTAQAVLEGDVPAGTDIFIGSLVAVVLLAQSAVTVDLVSAFRLRARSMVHIGSSLAGRAPHPGRWRGILIGSLYALPRRTDATT